MYHSCSKGHSILIVCSESSSKALVEVILLPKALISWFRMDYYVSSIYIDNLQVPIKNLHWFQISNLDQ